MSWFWQNTQPKLQPAMKMVPEPRRPTSGGSSPKCGPALDTSGSLPTPQNPFSPASRSTLHRRGQIRHGRAIP